MLRGDSCAKVISCLKMGASGNGNLDHHGCMVVRCCELFRHTKYAVCSD